MPGSKTAYLEQVLLNRVLNGGAFVPPATLYAALSTDPFTVTATGSAMSEVSTVGTAYARIAITANTINFPMATGSNPAVISNGTAINFAIATANWGSVLSLYLIDAAAAGNALYGLDLPAPVVVNIGASVSVPADGAIFQEF